MTAARDASRFINGLMDEGKIIAKLKAGKTNIVTNDALREQLRNKLSTLGPQLEVENFWSKGLYEYVVKMPK